MRLMEWQGKKLLAEAGVPVPQGSMAETPEAAGDAAARLGKPVMVKAQVRIGGRGKAGGILPAADAVAAEKAAESLFGREIRGRMVRQVLVEEQISAERELYVGLTVDYGVRRSVLLVGAEGGMDVEAAAEGGMARAEINPLLPLSGYIIRGVLNSAKIPRSIHPTLLDLIGRLYALYKERDATLLEINPLLALEDGTVVAADSRIVVDDSAIARQPDLADLGKSYPDATVSERLKLEYDFDYVELNSAGNIGLISTGAGGTMSQIDLLTRAGGRVINFADVRTGVIGRDPKRLIVILDQLAQKPNFNALLVSIFGAITDLAVFAETLLAALRARPIQAKVHVRLQGRNEEAARRLLAAAGVASHNTLEDAVSSVIVSSKENKR
jgi:succinyl-CoA synthetase beta subunit